MNKNFTSIESLTKEDIDTILRYASKYEEKKVSTLLENKTLVNLFFNPSTRTRVSFEIAMNNLGGNAISISPGESSWEIEIHEGAVMDGSAEEHLKDAINVLSRYADFIGVRCFPKQKKWEEERKDLLLKNILRWSSVPVINLETVSHPCQALSMLKTLRESKKKIKKFVLTWAFHPKTAKYCSCKFRSSCSKYGGL